MIAASVHTSIKTGGSGEPAWHPHFAVFKVTDMYGRQLTGPVMRRLLRTERRWLWPRKIWQYRPMTEAERLEYEQMQAW
jgi:hypothetical protein